MAASTVTGATGQGPYIGCHPFSTDESLLFFGRPHESAEVRAMWLDNRVSLLTGSSGVGRTSLLRSGVVPQLDRSRAEVLPVGRLSRNAVFPVTALPTHNPHTLALLTAWAPGEPETRLADRTIYDFLRKRSGRAGPYGQPLPILAAIDQAEELFIGPTNDRDRESFAEELAEALREVPQLHLLLVIPDDYLDDFDPVLQILSSWRQTQYHLRPLSTASAVAAMQEPARLFDRSYAADAADELIASLTTKVNQAVPGIALGPEVEPALLETVCAGLWAALPADVKEITRWDLGTYGNVDRLLASFCGQAVAEVADEFELPTMDIGRWLGGTFISEQRTRRSFPEGGTATAGLPNSMVRALRDRHILRSVWQSGARWYELLDDRLIYPVLQTREQVPADTGVVRVDPADHMKAAKTAMSDGNMVLAERHAFEVLRSTGEKDLGRCVEAESLLGNVAHSRGQAHLAETHYRAAAALFETLQDAHAVAELLAAIGQSLLAQGKNAEAVDYLHSAVNRIPNDLTVQTELAWALWRAGQQRAAVAVLTGVLAVDGDASNALRARGEILADLGDAEDAIRDLDRVRLHQQPSTRAARGLALAMLSRISAADPEISAALSRAPDSGPVLLYAARVAALSRDAAIAADLARRAVSASDPAVAPHQRRQALELIDLAL